MALFLRCAALVILFWTAGPHTCAQGAKTPAAQQQAEDRRFLLRRGVGANPGNGALPERLAAARAQQKSFAAASPTAARVQGGARPRLNTSTTTWQPAGPAQVSTAAYGLVTGRVSALAVDPNDTTGNTVYLGATGGGVWKSTNAAGNAGSVSFTPLTDDLSVFANSFTSIPSISIGAVSVEPGNPNVLLAGTGDPNDALDSYYGVGILRSQDRGLTWSLIKQSSDTAAAGNYLFRGLGFAGFAWSSANTNLVVAAASQSLEGLLVDPNFQTQAELGLYYSQDAGKTWYLATITDGTNEIIQSSNPGTYPPGNAATSVVWNPQRGLFLAAIRYHGYYSSPDGITWTRLANQPGAGLSTTNCPANPKQTGSPACPLFRGVLAVQPATGDTFALTTDLNNVDQGLYQDVCSNNGLAVNSCNSNAISFGTPITDTPLQASDGTIPQADYNLALSAVASQQDTILLAGTEDVFRCSLANSCQWRNTTNNNTCAAAQVAPSTHAIDGTDGANGLVYFANDGGLWRTTDTLAQTGSVCASSDASHFDNLNSGLGSLAEVSHLAVSPGNGSLVLAGMSAFGVVASESGAAQNGTGAWLQLLTGEGSYVAIDPTTPTNWYADALPGIGIFSCPNGGNCTTSNFGTTPVIGRAQVQDDTDYFLDPAPWILDPGNPANILLGTCRMWLGPASGSWSSSNLLSGMLDGNGGSFCNGNAYLRSVGAGGSYNTGGEQMYAGMAGPLDGGASVPGHLYGAVVPQSGGKAAWSDLWRNPVTNESMTQQFNGDGYAISSIAVDPHDTTGQTVYVSIAGFPTGQNGVLYSTTDGGAHWANLTNSLPIAPVNAVAVDPNDANSVYVAGDFGVYATNNIGICSTTGASFQNCWTQLGSNLPNAPVTDLKVYSAGATTVLEAATYGRGIWTLGLTTSSVPARATLSPASANLGSAGTGAQSATTGTFTLSNTGSIALTVNGIAATPSDYAQTNNCGSSVAVNGSCTITVTFTPTTTGDRPGTLTVRTNAQGGTLTAPLDGTGLTPGSITATPTSVAFPQTSTGSSSQPLNVQIQNTGGATVQLTGRNITGPQASEFSLGASTCGSSLAANATCQIPVVFTPSQPGTRTAQLQISSANNSQTVYLSGTAVTPAHLTISPTSLSYADTGIGNLSAAQTITIQNTGGAQAQLGSATVSSSDYRITANACGTVLAGGANCVINVAFAPTTTGSRPGLFTQPASNIPGGQVTASLSGNGLPAAVVTLSPGSLTFAAQQQGTTSAAQTININNSGGSPAQFGAFSTSLADFAIASNSCGTTLAVNAACAVTVTFSPTQTGSRTAAFTVPYSSTSVSAQLSGTGTAQGLLQFDQSSIAFPTTADNATSAVKNIAVTNIGGSPTQITGFSVTGPFNLAANNCPAAPQTLGVNASCTLGVTFTPPGTAAYSGSMTLSGNFSNAPATIALSGQGATPPNAALAPDHLDFPNTAQGSASAPQTFTLTSTGGVAVQLGTPTVSTSDYQISSSTCQASLAPGSTCSITVLFHPTATGPRPATFQLPGNMLGSPLTANLTGTGAAPGELQISPTTYQFGTRVIGSASAAQSFTVSNNGGSPVSLGTISVAPESDYAVGGSNCGASLPAGTNCSVSLVFTPSAAGDRPGQLTVPGDGAEASAVATLDGTGTTPGHLVFSPGSLAFGNVATDASMSSSVMMTNTGGTPVQVSSIAASGDFSAATGSCAMIAANNGTCTIAVTFTPTALGSRTGTLMVMNDGSPPGVGEPLSGNGVAPGNLMMSPGSLSFGTVAVNTAAPPQKAVTLTNGGAVAVSLQAPATTGSGYSVPSSGCGSSLDPGASCSLQVAFRPTQAGESMGSLSLAWHDAGSSGGTASVSLDGTGALPGTLTFSPSPVQFGQVVTGSSVSASVAVQNTGGFALSLQNPTVSNGFGVSSACAGLLAPGASCTVQVSFSPATTGSQQGLLTFASSDGSGNWSDSLNGTGVLPGALQATPDSLAFGPTLIGSNAAPQSVSFTNPGGIRVPLAALQLSSPEFSIVNSTCGAGLSPGEQCSVVLIFTPAGRGARSGTLTLAGSMNGGPVARVALSGTGLAPAQLSFTPGSLAFGKEAEYTRSSPPQTVVLQNTGDVGTSLGLPVVSGDYVLATNICGNSLAPGATCSLGVEFQPVHQGSLTGSLATAGTTGTPATRAALIGTGVALVLNPESLVFQVPLLVGASYTSPTQVSVANLDRQSSITLQPFAVTGDFALVSTTCGATLAPNSSCSVLLSFSPHGSGQRTGVLSVSDGIETGLTQLVGTGLLPATDTLSAASLTFPTTQYGSASPAQALTITNSGDGTLTQITMQVTGPFSVTNGCGAQLAGQASCPVAVQFKPQNVGNAAGMLTLTDFVNGALHTQTVALSGQGSAPPFPYNAPLNIDFGPYAYQVATTPRSVTFTNPSQVAIENLAWSTSDANFTVSSATCGDVLAPGGSCQIGVIFTPGTIGNQQGTLSLVGDFAGVHEKLVTSLSGSGEDYQLTLIGSDTQVITNGQTATYNFSVTPNGLSAGSVAMSCAGAPANSGCSANPTTVNIAGGASGFVTVTVTTNAPAGSALLAQPGSRWWTGGAALALLCPLLLVRGKARRRLLTIAAAVLLISAPIGCGVHASGAKNSVGGTQPGQTPVGTYTLTVNAAYPGVQRTAAVKLVVQ